MAEVKPAIPGITPSIVVEALLELAGRVGDDPSLGGGTSNHSRLYLTPSGDFHHLVLGPLAQPATPR